MSAVFNSRISDSEMNACRDVVLTCGAQAQGAWDFLLEGRSVRICYTSKRPGGVLSRLPRGK